MSVLHTLGGLGLTLRICIPTVVDAAVGRTTMARVDDRLTWWSKRVLDDAKATLDIQGEEHIPAGEPLVVMSNHRSYYDIPTVYRTIPGPLRMVAKKELFRVPLFGTAMVAAGFVRVDRSDRQKAIVSLRESEELIQRGTRVWIAPEGTRTKTGKIGEFKSGGFHLALATNVRILPMVLTGTENIMSATSFDVTPGAHVKARVLEPIDTASYGRERRKELMNEVRQRMVSALEKLEG